MRSQAVYACEECGGPVTSSRRASLPSPDTVLCSVCMTGATGRDDGALLSPAQLRSIRDHIEGIAHSFRAWEQSQQLQQPGGSRRQSLRPGLQAHMGHSQEHEQALPGARQPSQGSEPQRTEQVAGQPGQVGLHAQAGAERPAGLEDNELLSGRLQRIADSELQSSEQTAAALPQDSQPATGPAVEHQTSLANGLLPAADTSAAAVNTGSRAEALDDSGDDQMQCELTQDAQPAERRHQRGAEAMDGAACAQMLWEMAQAALPGKRRLQDSSAAEPAPKRSCWSSGRVSREPHQASGPWLQLALTPDEGSALGAHSESAAPGQGARLQHSESMQAGSRVRMKQRELVPVQSLLASTSQPPGRSGPANPLSGASPATSQYQMQAAWEFLRGEAIAARQWLATPIAQ